MADPLSRRARWMQKLADQVETAIAEKIRAGELTAGADLGTRASLSDEYVTSSQVIDRAIDKLIAEGVVHEHGDGRICVAGFPGPGHGFELPVSGEATKEDVLQVLELRIGVEAVAAALAAERRSDAQLQAIRDAADAFEHAAVDGQGAATADFRLHRAIAAASGNEYISDLMDMLGPLLIPRMRVTPPEPEGADAGANLRRSVLDHAEIVDAIANADPEAARVSMRNHLSRSLELMRMVET